MALNLVENAPMDELFNFFDVRSNAVHGCFLCPAVKAVSGNLLCYLLLLWQLGILWMLILKLRIECSKRRSSNDDGKILVFCLPSPQRNVQKTGKSSLSELLNTAGECRERALLSYY